MDKVEIFKNAHKKFTEALKYISLNEPKLRADPKHWELIKRNFTEKFEKSLDLSWDALSEEEKDNLLPLYGHRKALRNETVQKIMKVFKVEKIEVIKEKGK